MLDRTFPTRDQREGLERTGRQKQRTKTTIGARGIRLGAEKAKQDFIDGSADNPSNTVAIGSYIAYKQECSVRWNPTNAVGGSFILSLQDRAALILPGIPPTQLVDRSYSAYIDLGNRCIGDEFESRRDNEADGLRDFFEQLEGLGEQNSAEGGRQ
jgi:hypothetical protein